MDCLLDIKDAARFLKVSEMTIRRWTNSGKLKCYRIGGKRERRFDMANLTEFLHDSQNCHLKPLGIEGKMVPDGAHMTHYYSGEKEAFSVSLPYLIEGFKRNEALLAVIPAERGRKLLAGLEQQGFPARSWLKHGQLTLTDGLDSPDKMISYLVGFAEKANEFRVVGDMIWTVKKGWGFESLKTFEQTPTLFRPPKKGLLLCQYSLAEFSGSYIMMAAEFHKQMIYKGQLRNSPYYEL
ncbi:MAG: MEDS domain-containing protein [Desulfobacterales bacterium]